MSGWLVILLVVCGFAVGVHFGVNVLGGWRQFRRDLLEIHREETCGPEPPLTHGTAPMGSHRPPPPERNPRAWWPLMVAAVAGVAVPPVVWSAGHVAPKIAADTSLSTFPEQAAEPSAHGGPLAPMSIGVVATGTLDGTSRSVPGTYGHVPAPAGRSTTPRPTGNAPLARTAQPTTAATTTPEVTTWAAALGAVATGADSPKPTAPPPTATSTSPPSPTSTATDPEATATTPAPSSDATDSPSSSPSATASG